MNEIRIAALNDLQQRIPDGHYLLRPYSPEADFELTQSLLGNPIDLSLRELRAAKALADLAAYEIRSRAIFSIANPIRDFGDETPSPGMTRNEEREVAARFEVFRRSALDYARTLGDALLIERYQAPAPDDETKPGENIATPTPAEAQSANGGITTSQVAAIFDGLPYTAENWPKRLSDTKWLKPAQVALGAAGGATSLWCPATLAQLIHGKQQGTTKQKTLEALNKKFKNTQELASWRTAWNEHYGMFNDADDGH